MGTPSRSLKDLSDEDIERLWAEEAVRRDAELDSGEASMRDAEDVLRDVRARISGRNRVVSPATSEVHEAP